MKDLQPFVLFENTKNLVISEQEVKQIIGVRHSKASNFIGELHVYASESHILKCFFIDHDRDMIFHNGHISEDDQFWSNINQSLKDYTIEEMCAIVAKMSQLEQWVSTYLHRNYELKALPK